MTLTQLRYAITVSDAQSMNAAAKQLFISQPSLSASIKELEEEIGVESNLSVMLARWWSSTS